MPVADDPAFRPPAERAWLVSAIGRAISIRCMALPSVGRGSWPKCNIKCCLTSDSSAGFGVGQRLSRYSCARIMSSRVSRSMLLPWTTARVFFASSSAARASSCRVARRDSETTLAISSARCSGGSFVLWFQQGSTAGRSNSPGERARQQYRVGFRIVWRSGVR